VGKPVSTALSLKHIASPATPPAGELALYVKSDNKVYTKTPAGTEAELGGGSGSLPARLGTGALIVTDWNDATENGFYGAANTAANAPTADFYGGMVKAINTNYLEQTLFVYNNNQEAADTKTWRRMRVNGTWGSWMALSMSDVEILSLTTGTRTVTDWNTATSNGWYVALNTATNQPPVTANYVGLVTAAAANHATQTVWDYIGSSVDDTRMYRRQMVAGSWSAWYKVGQSSTDIRTMANEVPAYAANRANPFNPDTSFYNVTETSMHRLRGLLTKSGTQRIKIGFWGHSIFAGSLTSAVGSFDIASQVRRFLSAEQSNVSGTGFVYVENKIGTSPALGRDARWTSITGWTPANAINSMWASTTTNGAVATFVSDAPGTIVDVATFDITGPIRIDIDGITKETFTGTGSSTVVVRSFTGLNNARHTVTVTTTSTTASYLVGARVRSTVGLEVSNQAQGGSSILQWQSTGTYSQNYKLAQSVSPSEIVFLALGDGNEIFQATPVNTVQAALNATITDLKATGAAVVLMTAPAMSPSGAPYAEISEATWDTYVKMMYDVADNNDVPLLDCRHLFVSYATANAAGWMGDPIHPNDTGHAVIARTLATEMLKVIPYDSKPDEMLEETAANSPNPGAPASGTRLISFDGGAVTPGWVDASNQRYRVQRHIGTQKITEIRATPAQTALEIRGIAAAGVTVLNNATTTATLVTPTFTTFFGHIHRVRVASTAVAGSAGGLRTNVAYWTISNVANVGGFELVVRAGINAFTANNRLFVGMSATTGALTAGSDPSTYTNMFGFAANSAQSNYYFMHNDAAGAATQINLGPNFPCQTSATDFYEFRLYTVPGVIGVKYSLERVNTGHSTSGYVNTDLPAAGTALAIQIHHGNGVSAAAVSTDIEAVTMQMKH
jgi:lysophospholipase L1-like esterase